MQLADAFDQALGGPVRVHRPPTPAQLIAGAIAATTDPRTGRPNVSAAARHLGVPRRTLRNWITGVSNIPAERFRALAGSGLAAGRRAALDPGLEQAIRSGRQRLSFAGATTEKNTRRKGRGVSGGVEVRRNRRLDVGRHTPPPVMSTVLDMWLRGDDLADVQNALSQVIDDYYAPGLEVTYVTGADFR